MFKGKIRKCLKCGEDGARYGLESVFVSCSTSFCHAIETITTRNHYQAINEWNRANTPPEEITYILHFYARFGMRLP